MKKIAILLVLLSAAWGQTPVRKANLGNISNVPHLQVGTVVPGSCASGAEMFFKSDAEVGTNLYICYNGTFVVATTSTGTNPVGPAGGALNGTYPNPSLAAGINANLIADGSVSNTSFQLLGTATTNSTPGTLVLRDGSGNIPGTVTSLVWSAVTSKPDDWLNATNLVRRITNVNTAMPSGFYDGDTMANAPFTGYGNIINARHLSEANNQGFQLAVPHAVDQLWYRNISEGTGTWHKVAAEGGGPYSFDISGKAATATALAADPMDCSTNQFANGIAANGNLACVAITAAALPTHNHAATDINSGTLGIARGGTGLSTIASGRLLYASAADTLAALTLGSTLSIATSTLSVVDNSSIQKVEVWNNGIKVGTRKAFNLVPGTNVSFSIADDTPNDRVNITINGPATTLGLLNEAGNATITIQGNGASKYWITAQNVTNGNKLMIGGNGATDPATGAINIDNGGAVSIPGTLSVGGNTTLAGSLTMSGDSKTLEIGNTGASAGYARIRLLNNVRTWGFVNDTDSSLKIWDYTSAKAALTLDSNDNVTITEGLYAKTLRVVGSPTFLTTDSSGLGTAGGYFYVGGSGTFYATGTSVLRGSITNDGGNLSFGTRSDWTAPWLDAANSTDQPTNWAASINLKGNMPTLGFKQDSAANWYMIHQNTSLHFYRHCTAVNCGGWDEMARFETDGNFSILHNLTVSGTITGSITGSAGSVAWSGVTGRPTALSQFTNDSGYITSTNANYNVTAGDGNGLCFWQACGSYKISMGNAAEDHYGPVTGYSMRFTMASGADRGFVWRGDSGTIAGLGQNGNMQIAGQMTATQFNGTLNGAAPWGSISGKPGATSAHADFLGGAWYLAWKNYGTNHVIFDASQGTAPNGTAVNNTNPATNWSATYPTLMGWNGSSTYGVRVDSARVADSAPANGGNSDTVDSLHVQASAGQPNTIAKYDGNGYLNTGYINSNHPVDGGDPTYFVYNNGDAYLRYTAKATAANAIMNAVSHQGSFEWIDPYGLSLPASVQTYPFSPRAAQSTITEIWCVSDDANTIVRYYRSDGGAMAADSACTPSGSSQTGINGYGVIPVGYSFGIMLVSGSPTKLRVGFKYTTAY